MMRLSKRAAEADKRVICHHPLGVHSIFFAISQLCFVGKRKDGLFLSRFRGVKGGLFNYSAVSSSSVCFRETRKGKRNVFCCLTKMRGKEKSLHSHTIALRV